MSDSKAPSAETVLRPALIADAEHVQSCVLAAYEKWIARIGRKPWPMLQNYEEVIQNDIVFVVTRSVEIVGVLVLSKSSEGFLLDNIAVHPSVVGNGIGRLLLRHAEEQALSCGYESIYLYTNEKMTENIALYARNGYVEYERRQELGFCRVFMRKPLH